MHTATTVRVRGGKVSMTDGPFAETKEQLAGFYLIDAKNLDEAVQQAAEDSAGARREHRGAPRTRTFREIDTQWIASSSRR